MTLKTKEYTFTEAAEVSMHPHITSFRMDEFSANDALILVQCGLLESAHINKYDGRWQMWVYTDKIIALYE